MLGNLGLFLYFVYYAHNNIILSLKKHEYVGDI